MDNDKIEYLNLSVRSYDILKQNGINTVDELMSLNLGKLMSLENIDRASIDEVISVMQKITKDEIEPEQAKSEVSTDVKRTLVIHYIDEKTTYEQFSSVLFKNKLGIYENDRSVSEAGFSNRTLGALIRMNATMLSDVIRLNYSELKKIKGMGAKSLDEIMENLKEITIVRYGDDAFLDKIMDYIESDLNEHCVSMDKLQLMSVVRSYLLINDDNMIIGDTDELESNSEIWGLIYSDPMVKKIIEKYLISLIGKKNVSYAYIKENMPATYLETHGLDKMLMQLKAENVIDETEDGYCKYYPDFLSCLEQLKNEKAALALLLRTKGKTLEETGKELGVTRERARQLAKKAMENLLNVKELKYRYWYEKYNMTKADFKLIFNISEESYRFLNLYCKDSGALPLEQIFEDEQFTSSIGKRVEKAMHQYMVQIEDEYVPIDREKITIKLLEKYHSETECGVSEFYDEYKKFVCENGLDDNEKLLYSTEHALEARISDSNYVLMKYRRRIRYYNIEDYDIEALFMELQFDVFEGLELSTLKLWKNNIELMQEYDIHDEYELHNLMKKCESILPRSDISLGRMPFLTIGNADRGKQVEKFLYKVAPIGLYEFGNAYEEEYGIKSETVVANFISYIDKYYHNTILEVNQEVMNEFELSEMRRKLMNDFYFIEDVEKMYIESFHNGSYNKINSYNLKTLGFLVYVDYIVRNSYDTAENYFKCLLTAKDEIDVGTLDRRICYNQSFAHILEILRTDYTLLEIEQNKYISFDKLQSSCPEITKEQLSEYALSLPGFCKDDYFTIRYAYKQGFSSQIDDIGQSDWFYGALLRSNKNIRYSKVAGGFLFTHKDKQITRGDFFKFIVEKFERIHIMDFVQYIEKEYGLRFDRYDVTPIINNTSMIYVPASEMIYYDRSEFVSRGTNPSQNISVLESGQADINTKASCNANEDTEKLIKSKVENENINDLANRYRLIYDKAYRKLKEFTQHYHFEVTDEQLLDAIGIGKLETLKSLLNEATWAIRGDAGRYVFYNHSNNYVNELEAKKDDMNDAVEEIKNIDELNNSKEISKEKSEHYSKILKLFSRGFRFGSALEVKKFRRYYEEIIGDELTESDKEIEAELLKIGVLYENRLYAPDNMIKESTADKLDTYVHELFNSGKSMVYYEALFREFEIDFSGEQIYSTDMLKRYLEYHYRGQYYMKRSFMTNDLEAETDTVEEIKQCLIKSGRIMTFEEIFKQLPHIPVEKIKHILAGRQEFIRDSIGCYFAAEIVHFTGDELRNIELIINNIIDLNGFCAGNKLLEAIANKYSEIYEKLSVFQELGKREFIAYWLRDRFSFNGNIISERGRKYKMQDIFDLYCQKHTTVTMDMLNSMKGELNTSIYFDAVYKNKVRISENEFISKENVSFSILKTDNAIDKFFTDLVMPLKSINQFATFPDAGYPWNIYLLESFVYAYSHEFLLVHNATFNAKPSGAIVKRESGLKTFDDVAAYVLGNSKVGLIEENALDYLYDNGYIARRKVSSIDQIIVNAKIIREKRGD